MSSEGCASAKEPTDSEDSRQKNAQGATAHVHEDTLNHPRKKKILEHVTTPMKQSDIALSQELQIYEAIHCVP